MHQARTRITMAALMAVTAGTASAQIPDLLNALDAGGRSMGVAGATQATDGNTFSTYYNPAGLAFLQSPVANVTFRNLPESDTVLSRRFANPDFSTDRRVGSQRLSHVGYAMPMKGGVLGVSYTLGGFVRDNRTGSSLANGETQVNNLVERLQAQLDYFTVAYARQRGATNYGVGIVVVNQYVQNTGNYDLFDANNNLVGTVRFNNSGNSTGVGLIAGVQRVSGDGSSVIGASLRTPISLSRETSTDGYMRRVPGRLSVGYAARSGFLQRGKDFLAYGAQLDYFFGGQTNAILDRDNTFAGSFGAEYNLHRGGARIPVRIGYAFVPAGGDAFSNRDSLAFGIGYRPDSSPISVDIGFAIPSGGGSPDAGLSLTYRLK